MTVRFYSSIADATTLTGGVTPSDTTMAVASTAGFPGSTPYTLAVDYGSAGMELVEVTGVASLTLTITRGIDGTSASAHSVGAVVRHVASGRDFKDSRDHENASTNVHGLSGGAAVVGTTSTQTLTNKTVTNLQGSARNFSMFNVGATGITQIIGDSANPGASRLEIKDDETSLNTMLFVQSNGNIKSVKNVSDTDGTYKWRLTDNDGSTDRSALLAGGTMGLTPTSTTGFPALQITAPDLSTSKRAIRVSASGGSSERFTVWNDGRVDIVGSDAAFSTFDVTAPSTPSADMMRVMDSGSNTQFAVQSSGRTLSNKGATIAQPGVLSGTVLQVGGSNTGYTGDLQTWVSPANAIVARVDQDGVFTSAVQTASGSGIFTANGPNWVFSAASARRRNGVVTLYLQVTRANSSLSSPSSGNLTDTTIGTFDSAWRPPVLMTTNFDMNGAADGSAKMSELGNVTLTSLTPSTTINIGDTVTMSFTYVE